MINPNGAEPGYTRHVCRICGHTETNSTFWEEDTAENKITVLYGSTGLGDGLADSFIEVSVGGNVRLAGLVLYLNIGEATVATIGMPDGVSVNAKDNQVYLVFAAPENLTEEQSLIYLSLFSYGSSTPLVSVEQAYCVTEEGDIAEVPYTVHIALAN